MRKATLFVSAILLMMGGCLPLAGEASGLFTSGGDYDFDFLIKNIIPAENGEGAMILGNRDLKTDSFGSKNIAVAMYRLEDGSVKDIIRTPDDLGLADEMIGYNALDLQENNNALVHSLGNLWIGEGKNHSFYYTVWQHDSDGLPILIGTRRVSYESCASALEFREGEVCILREQGKSGALYYDAWIDGEMVRGSEDEEAEIIEGGDMEEGNEDDKGDNDERDNNATGKNDDMLDDAENSVGGLGGEDDFATKLEDDNVKDEAVLIVNSVVKNTKTDTNGGQDLDVRAVSDEIDDDVESASADSDAEQFEVPITGEPESNRGILAWVMAPSILLVLGLVLLAIWKRRKDQDDEQKLSR